MNRLQNEKSPYLRQHADNPVDWRPWGAEAFAAARRENKPVFLSVGYSTCHWCHVMARESFEDADAAAALNRNFIPVKVDREERPDVDSVYMAACVAMNGSGGWPLTALLTPEQQPFWAGTYLSKEQLLSLLSEASRLWRDDRAEVRAAGEALTGLLRREAAERPGEPSRALVAAGVSAFGAMFDPVWGGFGPAPKFPSAHNLLFLLRYAAVSGDRHAREMAESTLEHMYRGGIFDHVGGGFSRYSTDEKWLAPHFEKMLYDNALLALAYTEAWQQTRRPYYEFVVRRTLDYVLRELSDPAGGFCCGQDADSEGVEGKYYVFSRDELITHLGSENSAFSRRFGATARGNFQGNNILNLIGTEDWETPAFADSLQKLHEYRRSRTTLRRDDKVLTGWNGLMIAALARAGFVLQEPRYTDAAARTADFIARHLTGADGRLLARWRDGEAAHPGKLEDYAYLAWGLLELYAARFRAEYLERALALADALLLYFFDLENGGCWPYASDGEQLIARTKESYDGALPSGNAVAGLVLSRLGRLTGEPRWREAASLQLHWLAGAAEAAPAGHGFALLAFLEELWPGGELVCAAREVPAALTELLRETPRPGLSVLVKTPETAARLAALAPFTDAYPVPEAGARYYLCRNGSCEQPVDSIDALRNLL